jgi:hypothetical protein
LNIKKGKLPKLLLANGMWIGKLIIFFIEVDNCYKKLNWPISLSHYFNEIGHGNKIIIGQHGFVSLSQYTIFGVELIKMLPTTLVTF